MKESSIVARIVRHLRDEYPTAWWFKVHGGPFQRAGVPDLLVCHEGRLHAFEVKVPGEKPTMLQRHELQRLEGAGAVAEVVTSWEQVDAALTRARED